MKKIIFSLFIISIACANNSFLSDEFSDSADPTLSMNCSEIIPYFGYPLETHKITTEDGYILTMFRIPHGKDNANTSPKVPILLQHGLLDSSATWVMNFPSESLGFILADAGYDVWLGNNRGNSYSREHVKYTVKDAEFWDFSFNEMAYYDLPSFVDYIINETGHDQIAYNGHSQGTIQMFVALSEFGEKFQHKIRLFNAMAPVAYVYNQNSVLLGIMAEAGIDKLVQLFGFNQFLPSDEIFKILAPYFCGPFPYACEDIMFLLFGPNSDPEHNLNKTRMQEYIYNTPAGTSVKNMVHWAQLIRNKNFGQYNYGIKGNIEHYGAGVPPQYDLSKIANTRVALFTGSNDALADPTDVAILEQQMNSSLIVLKNNQDSYEHLDFTWGANANVKIYPDVLKLMKNFFPEQQADRICVKNSAWFELHFYANDLSTTQLSGKSKDFIAGSTQCMDLNTDSLSNIAEGDSITVTVNADLGDKNTSDLSIGYKKGISQTATFQCKGTTLDFSCEFIGVSASE